MIFRLVTLGVKMARYRGPKNRIARKYGANLFGRSRNPLLHKPNPPGQHGARRRKKSDFGLQLDEKQKLKACYGMLMERQMVKMFKEAASQEGNTSHLFMARLECRLDTVVFRLGFAATIFAAQQLVSHGHIQVDGRKVDRRAFFVKPGMEIAIREKSRKMKAIADAMEARAHAVPSYLELNKDHFLGRLLMTPELDQIEGQLPLPINIPVVCEFLSHHN